MGIRREARECAVQILFQLDLNPGCLDGIFNDFWTHARADDSARRFAEELVKGVRENLDTIDASVRKYAEHWDIGRMRVVDRNVIRLAVYEMFFRQDIPPVVSINEAVDIAKYFSDSKSGRFVNGILDRARLDLDRPARSAGG